MSKERFIVRYGKYGAYFWDANIKSDMTLEQVAFMLNMMERKLREKGVDF